MEFRKPTLADAPQIREIIASNPTRQLIGCFEAFFIWRDIFCIEYSFYEGFVLFRGYSQGIPFFFYPFGKGDVKKAVSAMIEESQYNGYTFSIRKATGKQCDALRGAFGDMFAYEAVRDNYEYIYATEKFLAYSGSHLQPKRNFVNRLKREHSWSYEPLSANNICECKGFAEKFPDSDFSEDNEALRVALDHYDSLRLDGGILRVDGKISSLFIVSPLSDGETAAGMFLRGDHSIPGAIPLLYSEFFRANSDRYRYVNLAEDLGIEGLRRNKLSYQPTELLDLYNIEAVK